MSDNPKHIPVSLTVARVPEGGNTGHERYFFVFEPHPVLVRLSDSRLTFSLSDESPNYIIEDMITSDARDQIGPFEIAPSGREVTVAVRNSVAYLVQVALLLRDKETGETVVCDPQVVCRPPPHTAGG
ncbi:hypothetical protein [Tahibacter caeni]|uniref:hypothetical protein n=1 Tax=Tahibacter caeni TaxID=1453545 RepID=UPI002148D1D7|nr:hypothetical protein [Tahibacter caeni]